MGDIPRIYFDGEARPNPGKLRAGIVVVQDQQARIGSYHTGQGNSHYAEWLALIVAARTAVAMGAPRAELVGSNIGVIDQANGGALIRDPVIQQMSTQLGVLRGLCRLDVFYVERGVNLAGRLLETGNTAGFRCKVRMCENAEVVDGPLIDRAIPANCNSTRRSPDVGC